VRAEAIRERNYGVKSDVWACGITLVEMLTRKEPFGDLAVADVLQVVVVVVVGVGVGCVSVSLCIVLDNLILADVAEAGDEQADADHTE
jgi:serine/threonine protein kinase